METNIHTTTWNFRLLKKLLSQNLVVLVKLIVDGNWIYSFENISSSMFLAHCDTLKKYEHKLHWFGLLFECCGIWLLTVNIERKKYNYSLSPVYWKSLIWCLKMQPLFICIYFYLDHQIILNWWDNFFCIHYYALCIFALRIITHCKPLFLCLSRSPIVPLPGKH